MDIDENLIRKVAKVARVNLTDEELKRFIPQFKEIVEHFSTLRDADISNLQPAFHPIEFPSRERNDEPKPCLDQKEALSLTSHRQDAYFKGPKVMK